MHRPIGALAIPQGLVAPYAGALHALGIVGKLAIARVRHYRIPVVFFSTQAAMSTKEFESIISQMFPRGITEAMARVGSRNVSLISCKPGKITIEAPKDASDAWPEASIALALRQELEDMSVAGSGLNIHFHSEDREQHPPLPDLINTVHIFPWASPPGAIGNIYVSKVFGLFTDIERNALYTFQSTSGRGEVVGDGSHDLVQMVGNNWYLLTPIATYYNEFTGEEIASRILALAYNRWALVQCGGRPLRRPVSATRATFVDAASQWVDGTSPEIAKQLTKMDERICRLTKDLARVQRDRADLLRVQDAFKSKCHVADLLEGLPMQWRRIARHSRVEHVTLIEDAIHVTTKPVVIEYQGKRYPIGPFTIRVGKSGILSIWNEERAHPAGIPHPHVSAYGYPCFGNATTAVYEAAAEHRYADVIAWVITWLFDGYQHDLATHKVTEWPYESVSPSGQVISCIDLQCAVQAHQLGEVSE